MNVITEKKSRKDFIFTNRFYTLEKLIAGKQLIDTNSKLFSVYREIVNHTSRNCKKLFSKEFYILNNQVLAKNFLISIISDEELSKKLNLSKSSIRRYKASLRRLGFFITFKQRYHQDTSLYLVGIKNDEGFEHLFSEQIISGNIDLHRFKKVSIPIHFKEDLRDILQTIHKVKETSSAPDSSHNLQEIKRLLKKASAQIAEKSLTSSSHTICAKVNTICANLHRSEEAVKHVQDEEKYTKSTACNRTNIVKKRNVIRRLIVNKRNVKNLIVKFNNINGDLLSNYIYGQLRKKKLQLKKRNYMGDVKENYVLGGLEKELTFTDSEVTLKKYIPLRKDSQIDPIDVYLDDKNNTSKTLLAATVENVATVESRDNLEYTAKVISPSTETLEEKSKQVSVTPVPAPWAVLPVEMKESLVAELSSIAESSEPTISADSFFKLKDFLKGNSTNISPVIEETASYSPTKIEVFKDTKSTIESRDAITAFKETVKPKRNNSEVFFQQEALFSEELAKKTDTPYCKRSALEIIIEKIDIVLKKNPEYLQDKKVKYFINIVSSLKNKSVKMKDVNDSVYNYFSLEPTFLYGEFCRKVFCRFSRADYLDFIEEIYSAYGLKYNIYEDIMYFIYIPETPDDSSEELTLNATYYTLVNIHSEYISKTFIHPKLAYKMKKIFNIDDLIVLYFQHIFFTKKEYKLTNLLIPFLKLLSNKFSELSTELSDIRMTNIFLSKVKLEIKLRRLVMLYFLAFLSDVVKIKSIKVLVHILNNQRSQKAK